MRLDHDDQAMLLQGRGTSRGNWTIVVPYETVVRGESPSGDRRTRRRPRMKLLLPPRPMRAIATRHVGPR